MIYLIFSLFILYTVLCCLDGPDLKPKWQNWLGHKLHSYADKYVNYADKYYTPLEFSLPKYNIPIYETRYVPIRIQSNMRVSEMDLYYHCQNKQDKEQYMKLIKMNCINSLFDQIRKNENDLIEIEEIVTPYGSIDIRGEIQVCTKKKNI